MSGESISKKGRLKMDNHLEKIYLGQVQQELNACFAAIESFNSAIQQCYDSAIETGDDPFTHAMTLVHRAAAASRIFWPPKGRKSSEQRSQNRGEHLQKALMIDKDHPISSRTLRDHFEHFDERLDQWAEESKNRNIILRFLGPRSAVGGSALADGDIIFHFDPATNIFAFRGQKFDLQELANGVVDLNSKVQERLNLIQTRGFNQQ